MKQLFILFICLLPLSASAQFFNFGFGDDRYSQREQETVTKPEYKGGTDAINKYLKKNFRNPPMEKKAQRVCKKMKFKPAKRGKKKVKSRFDIVFPIRRSRLSFSTLQTVDL